MSRKTKPIDKVTPQLLDVALRACGMSFPIEILDRIIDVVELLEDKGGEVRLKDTCRLVGYWEKHYGEQITVSFTK